MGPVILLAKRAFVWTAAVPGWLTEDASATVAGDDTMRQSHSGAGNLLSGEPACWEERAGYGRETCGLVEVQR
jgi:hypothetical protein